MSLGKELVGRGIRLIYGGGCVGLMGILADTVLAAGGEVIGVIPHALVQREVAHRGLSELRVVDSMHERKALMADLADGFIALPGGIGTFEEFCEILTWTQLGLHTKPSGILNVCGYYDQLLAMLKHAVAEGFLREEHLDLFVTADDAVELLDRLQQSRPPQLPKWIGRDET